MIETLIIGPCQHENLDHSKKLIELILEATNNKVEKLYYKASFDKANRSSISGKRGVGLNETLLDFEALKLIYPNIMFLTDVHENNHIIDVSHSGVVDVIQIPAFLCRQTDLIQRACQTDMIVNVKKGQFLAPWDMKGILSKTDDAKEVWITERGTSFGYNTLVNDFTGMQYIMDNFDNKFVYDVTHSVQKPGGLGTSSGGNRDYVPRLAYAAAAMGIDSFFMEVHDDPDNAPSDGPNMIDIKNLSSIIEKLNLFTEMSDKCKTFG